MNYQAFLNCNNFRIDSEHWISDFSFKDLGENKAEGNNDCNGVWVDRGLRSCESFRDSRNTVPPTASPIDNSPVYSATTAPIGGVGYFNYNMTDSTYGPSAWGNVRENAEYLRYNELAGTLKRSLVNKCDWKNVNQSPIDLCENKINNSCDEYHQTRSHVSWED